MIKEEFVVYQEDVLNIEADNTQEILSPEQEREILLRQMFYGEHVGLLAHRRNIGALSLEALRELASLEFRSPEELAADEVIRLHAELENLQYEDGFMYSLQERAKKKPMRVAVAARAGTYGPGKKGHIPTDAAITAANSKGVAHAELVVAEFISDEEKDHWVKKFAEITERKLRNKIDKSSRSLIAAYEKREAFLSNGTAEEAPAEVFQNYNEIVCLEKKIAQLESKLENSDFLADARNVIYGDSGSMYIALLRALINGEYDVVVGGGDAPSAEFLRAFLQINEVNVGPVSSVYISSGPVSSGVDSNYYTESKKGVMYPGRVVAWSDPAVQEEPTIEQRARAAWHSGRVLETLAPQLKAVTAFESSSTGPSGKGRNVELDRAAWHYFRDNIDPVSPSYGPMQPDASLVKSTAASKLVDLQRGVDAGTVSEEELRAYEAVAGGATVLSFLNLAASNSAVKIASIFGDDRSLAGPIVTPTNIPTADGSGTCTIVDVSRGVSPREVYYSILAGCVLAQAGSDKESA